jgi:hypothetical protein
MEAAACEAGPSVATVDAGSTVWSCLEGKCGTQLTACAADCPCNNGVAMALMCIQGMGGQDASAAIMQTCFTSGSLGPLASKMDVSMLFSCLLMNSPMCGGASFPDAGEGGAGEGGGDAATE